MSEEDRSRLYAWLRAQTDETLAEYLMSCLAPAPLSDLVTKQFLTAELSRELSRFATKEELAELDTKVVGLDTKVVGLDTKVANLDSKVDRLAAQRDEDRRENRTRHYWLAGIGLSAAVPIWLTTAGVIG